MASSGPPPGGGNQNVTWSEILSSLYPDILTSAYCVPPVHFNMVPYSRCTVPGTNQPALVLNPPSNATSSPQPCPPTSSATSSVSIAPAAASQQPSQSIQFCMWSQDTEPQAKLKSVQTNDLQDDFAQNFVLINFQALAKHLGEGMFVISQLDFGSYLRQPSYAAAVASLPKPIDLDTQYQRGEFDILLIHRLHGILIGEIKSVGVNQMSKTQAELDADVAKKIRRAVKQLDKSEKMVKYVLSDIAPTVSVRKTLILPFVSTVQLRRVLNADAQLEQMVCDSLAASPGSDVTKLCCCSDHFSDPKVYWDVTQTTLSRMSCWWQARMSCTTDTGLNDQLYLNIVARFVGPATTVYVHCNIPPRVEVRTAGQAVAELGRRLARLVLTPDQVKLMNLPPPQVCLTGPPGTGKTILMVLMGLRWLLQGLDVHVVSMYPESRAASFMIQNQLRMTLDADPTASTTAGVAKLHRYDFNSGDAEVDAAITDLRKASKNQTLCVLMDEAGFGNDSVPGRLRRFIQELKRHVSNFNIWASCIDPSRFSSELHVEFLMLPLRCAPTILREIKPAFTQLSNLKDYTNDAVPSPGDGPHVMSLHHSHHGDCHSSERPVDCFHCGQNVATELQRLGVGVKGSTVTANSPEPLKFSDVFILTRCSKLQDDIRDAAGKVSSPACGLVRGLRDAGLPLCVLGQQDRSRNVTQWEEDVADTAVAGTDRITLAHITAVFGLERKVVVWIPGRDDKFDDNLSAQRIDAGDRLVIVSRATTQLLVVKNGPPSDGLK